MLLADARGTVWNGSATAVLTGGPDSRDAAALPGRLHWTLGWRRWFGLELRLAQPCCLHAAAHHRAAARLRPLQRHAAAACRGNCETRGRWPAAWLSGLGTPWNTLQLGGELRLASPGLTVERVQGRWRFAGPRRHRAGRHVVARLDPRAARQLPCSAWPAIRPRRAPPRCRSKTIEGALQLTGSGTWGPSGLRFRGEASAQPGDEAALANLLNIIGRRSGARSVISIG